jgi:hypothetical protein
MCTAFAIAEALKLGAINQKKKASTEASHMCTRV